jgi:hypothetical protein
MVGSLTLPVDRGSKLADVISSVTDKASTQITTFRTDIAGASVPQTARVLKAASSMQDAGQGGHGQLGQSNCVCEEN